MGITENDKCPYCTDAIETLTHPFIECPHVVDFWRNVEQWVKHIEGPHIKIGESEKIFGSKNLDCFTYRAIMATTQIIYRNRQSGKKYALTDVKRITTYQMQMGEYRAFIFDDMTHFNIIWTNAYDELRTT